MDPDLTIVLVGNTGVGKSASGNTILGRPVFESKHTFTSVTKHVSKADGQIFGKQILVIDTPGILGSEEEIKNLCQDVLQSSGTCFFLVVVRANRFTQEDQQAVEAAIRVIGPQGIKLSSLLFTGGDALNNRLLVDIIREDGNDQLQDTVKTFERRLHLFNNHHDQHERQKQVQDLLEKLDTYLLLSNSAGPEDPVKLDDRRIVLLGRPGGGRSSSGNTILGSDQFRSGCNFDSVSTECVSESAEVEGCWVTVVDTPGFTDEVLIKTPQKLSMEIMKTFFEASPGPHAFVIVVKVGPVSDTDIRMFEILQTLFGDDSSKYTMVLFTHGDELRDQSIDQVIQSNRHVSNLVSMCGGRYCVFNNNQRGNRQQVRKLLEKIDEMVLTNGGKHFTSTMFSQSVQLGGKKRTNLLKRKYLMAMLIGALLGAIIGGVTGAVIGGAMGVLIDMAKGAVKGGMISAGVVGVIDALTSVFHRTKD